MIFSKKNFFIFILFGLLIGSAYAFVSKNQKYDTENSVVSEPIPLTSTQTPTPSDTTKKEIPRFPIKKFTQNTYEDLGTKLPMDAPKPSNVKSVVEYDTKTGNYVLRTFVGDNEIATPFLMTEQEYKNFSAKKELQDYWKEKNSKVIKSNANPSF